MTKASRDTQARKGKSERKREGERERKRKRQGKRKRRREREQVSQLRKSVQGHTPKMTKKEEGEGKGRKGG